MVVEDQGLPLSRFGEPFRFRPQDVLHGLLAARPHGRRLKPDVGIQRDDIAVSNHVDRPTEPSDRPSRVRGSLTHLVPCGRSSRLERSIWLTARGPGPSSRLLRPSNSPGSQSRYSSGFSKVGRVLTILVVALVTHEVPDDSQRQRLAIVFRADAADPPQEAILAKVAYIAKVRILHATGPRLCPLASLASTILESRESTRSELTTREPRVPDAVQPAGGGRRGGSQRGCRQATVDDLS